MRMLEVPARYAPEIERAITSAVRQCLADAELRDESDGIMAGFIEDEMIDASLTGTLVISVLALPEQADVKLFAGAAA